MQGKYYKYLNKPCHFDEHAKAVRGVRREILYASHRSYSMVVKIFRTRRPNSTPLKKIVSLRCAHSK